MSILQTNVSTAFHPGQILKQHCMVIWNVVYPCVYRVRVSHQDPPGEPGGHS